MDRQVELEKKHRVIIGNTGCVSSFVSVHAIAGS